MTALDPKGELIERIERGTYTATGWPAPQALER